MTVNKTKEGDASVPAFLRGVENNRRRDDCKMVMDIMERVTGERPKMWGTSIIGFGRYHYKYESGREGDMMVIGLSPRKQALTIYIINGFAEYDDLMNKLGKFRTGKSCLYMNKLEDIDLKILERLIEASVKFVKMKYPE